MLAYTDVGGWVGVRDSGNQNIWDKLSPSGGNSHQNKSKSDLLLKRIFRGSSKFGHQIAPLALV